MLEVTASSLEIRKAHVGHEASVRGIALLYYAVAVLLSLASFAVLFFWFSPVAENGSRPAFLLTAVVLIGVAVLYAVLARGIRHLKRWSRIPATVLACIGLGAFPLGTVINGYILYLLHSEKGKTIFSPDYRRIIMETPGVVYKTPMVLWILLILVVVVFLVVIIGAAWTIDWTAHVPQK